MRELLRKYIIYIAWVQTLIAMLISLYFSEVAQIVPCVLCWYQRILMYPLVIILTVGILNKDRKIYQYVLPMSLIGGVIALYHVFLQIGIIPEQLSPCTIVAPCVTKFAGYFGFITIPLMSFTAFGIITLCMLIYRKNQGK